MRVTLGKGNILNLLKVRQFEKQIMVFSILPKNECWDNFQYSHLFNKRGGWNKRVGGAKVAKSLNVEARINVEGGFTVLILR